MKDNYATIVVGADGVDVRPDNRRVKPVAEVYKLGIEWPAQHGWDSVTVDNFRRVGDGSKVDIRSPLLFRPKDGNVVQSVEFEKVETRDDFCNYDVTAHEAKKKPLVKTFVVELLSIYGAAPAAVPAPPGSGGKKK